MFSKVAPSKNWWYVKESCRLFVAKVSWNISFGRKYETMQKRVNNEDSNAGTLKSKMENTALHLMHLYLKPEYRGKALGRDIVLSCERLARGEGRGRVCCEVHTKCLPVQQFFKARGYRLLKPVENAVGGIPMQLTEMEKML